MPRQARSRAAEGMLEPGAIYHIVNRGVNHANIFSTDLDRVVFLSILALAAVEAKIIIHAFCLMDNHFHLLVEDPRGLVSQLMLRLQGTYGRYFNDMSRRSGHLFEGRYRCDIVDTPGYFDAAASYILLNPLRTQTPLASTAESYQWSSAALTCSNASSAEWIGRILAAHGGVDGVLASLPKSRDWRARRNRRMRLEALAAGDWIVGHAIRGRCTPVEYAQLLEARRAMPRPTKTSNPIGDEALLEAARVRAAVTPAIDQLPRCGASFAGLDLGAVKGEIETTCDKGFPRPLESADSSTQSWRMRAYLLWRFTSSTLAELAEAISRTVEEVNEAIVAVRRARTRELAWDPVLRRLEWHLRLRLRAAPWRA